MAGSGADYSATIHTALPPGQVAAKVLGDLDRWWATRLERHGDGADQTGFTVRFNNSHATFRVDPGGTDQHFSWTCTDAHMIIEDVPDTREWTGTRLVWTVRPDGQGSAVTMEHEGLGPQIACFDVCTRGWQHFFETSLKAHLDGQPAAPAPT